MNSYFLTLNSPSSQTTLMSPLSQAEIIARMIALSEAGPALSFAWAIMLFGALIVYGVISSSSFISVLFASKDIIAHPCSCVNTSNLRIDKRVSNDYNTTDDKKTASVCGSHNAKDTASPPRLPVSFKKGISMPIFSCRILSQPDGCVNTCIPHPQQPNTTPTRPAGQPGGAS